MLRISVILTVTLCVCACTTAPVIKEEMRYFDGPLPSDLSGSWERNYARDDDVNAVLREAYYQLSRTSQDQYYNGNSVMVGPSSNDMASVVALARLAELITRPDVLTITQDEHEISIEREDDFAMLCSFYNGATKANQSPYGNEVCGWDGKDLVSNLVLPDGLQVTHRFTKSDDGQQLRVITTVTSKTSRLPFSLRRFYKKFEHLPSSFECIETLSMKRVCSTSEVKP
ncbi:MAG TPA: hypothetical protein PKK10_13645 [Woeseiaceae bacterium]|nr:hypothetical protein [Woeseiaceae bacterium]